MTEHKATTIRLDATARKGWGREAGWTATMSGLVHGHGATMGEAREALSTNVQALVYSMSARPAVVMNDDGALLFFRAEGTGYACTSVRDGVAQVDMSSGEGTPSDAADRIVSCHVGARRLA